MRPRSGSMPLAMAITLALVAKIIILTLLYKAFFAAPQAKKMRMPTSQVEQHLLGTAAPLSVSVSTSKATHDPHR